MIASLLLMFGLTRGSMRGGSDFFAFVTPTRFVAPPYPPALSTPAGAEREPNSRMWPTLFTEVLHAVGQFVDAVVGGRYLCNPASQINPREFIGGRLQLFVNTVLSGCVLAASKTKTIQSTNASPRCPSACKTSVNTSGQIWLLAPLSAPAGVERGGGDRGGIKRQNIQNHPNQTAINRYLSQLKETPKP